MKPRYKLVLAHIDGYGVPRFNIWERHPGAFWGETWLCMSYQPMPLDIANMALDVLKKFESEKGTP
jgi:hypothetical protein